MKIPEPGNEARRKLVRRVGELAILGPNCPTPRPAWLHMNGAILGLWFLQQETMLGIQLSQHSRTVPRDALKSHLTEITGGSLELNPGGSESDRERR